MDHEEAMISTLHIHLSEVQIHLCYFLRRIYQRNEDRIQQLKANYEQDDDILVFLCTTMYQ